LKDGQTIIEGSNFLQVLNTSKLMFRVKFTETSYHLNRLKFFMRITIFQRFHDNQSPSMGNPRSGLKFVPSTPGSSRDKLGTQNQKQKQQQTGPEAPMHRKSAALEPETLLLNEKKLSSDLIYTLAKIEGTTYSSPSSIQLLQHQQQHHLASSNSSSLQQKHIHSANQINTNTVLLVSALSPMFSVYSKKNHTKKSQREARIAARAKFERQKQVQRKLQQDYFEFVYEVFSSEDSEDNSDDSPPSAKRRRR